MLISATRPMLRTSIATLFAALMLTTLVLIIGNPTSYAGDNTWTPIGLYGVRIVDIAVDPQNSQVIYAATSGTGGVYKSTDAGLTWRSILTGWGWHEKIFFDPSNSNTVYVSSSNFKFYKSPDAGNTWITITLPLPFVSGATISPLDGTLYVSAYSTNGEAITDHAIFRSDDSGQSWTRLATPLAAGLFTEIVIAPSAPHIIYAASDSDRGVYKSVDRGATWQAIDTAFGLPPIVYSMAVDPSVANLIYLGTADSSIFRSNDGGQTWTPIGSGLGTNCIWDIQIDPGNQQVIYVGGGTPNFFPSSPGTPGVYWSLDNAGNSWAPLMNGMGSRAIMSLALDSNSPRNIYAGTDGSGVWKYTLASGPQDFSVSINDGALFTNQTSVTLTLTAPAGTTQMIISNDGGFGGATWEPFATQKPWTITTYGSYVMPRVVYAKFKTHGQISGLYQDDIVLDVTAPTGTVEITGMIDSLVGVWSSHSVTVLSTLTETLTNTVYLPLVMRNHRPGFRQVGLYLSATDDVSGVDEMLISNDASLADAQWEAYTTKKNWWVPDTGTTTVYVKFRDRAGNESLICSDTVTP